MSKNQQRPFSDLASGSYKTVDAGPGGYRESTKYVKESGWSTAGKLMAGAAAGAVIAGLLLSKRE